MNSLDNLLRPEVNPTNVLDLLMDLQISPNQMKSEKSIERILARQLASHFGMDKVHQQYSIPGFWGMKVDIDLGDGLVGIELKLASTLEKSAANVQRLFGQATYYSDRVYYDHNLIMVIVGNERLENKPAMREIERLLDDIHVHYYYVATSRRK